MKAWLKGGLVGGIAQLVVFILDYVLCMIGRCEFGPIRSVTPYIYIIRFTGIDYILSWIQKILIIPYPINPLIYAIVLFFVIGMLSGSLSSKEVSLKRKIVVFLIIILLITPLSIYSHYLKYNDEKILLEYRLGAEGWFIPNHLVCKELSIFALDYREACLSADLMPKEEAEALEKFSRTPEMQECMKTDSKWVCISKVAKELNDEKICEYGVLSEANIGCIHQIAISRNDISLCQKPENYSVESDEYITGAYQYDDCIIAIAKNTNDITLCENIKKTRYQYDECKSNLIKHDIESCETLQNYENYGTRYKDDCIIKVALSKIDLTICDFTEHPQKREECIEKIAMKTRNIELCKTFDIIRPDYCISTIAYLEEDEDVCDELDTDLKRDRCVDDVKDIIKGRLNVDYIEEYR